ncbi:MlaE family ABC transporter permease [Stratiformator vulcanicus]|uniref:ABC transport permease subunit MlaE n=1 Tax=Stratiformator vulcanicus TaxID=2527980 RepID=A0A517QYG1_9PLAN|nr:ABC transporter permease [Stratiformator vulcanicus]QDT36672.1 ABC transport permease subunit MlaE [Stratiformator vulcanicus]
MATVSVPRDTSLHRLGRVTLHTVCGLGDLTLFALNVIRSSLAGRPRRSVTLTCMYEIGVLSLPVVLVTGGFIGMVLAVQSFDQLRLMRLENRLGSVINITIVKELGPVLAATMLAGRVGSAIAAELGTMRVTEQIDALRALGANPIRHLVVPRFLACLLLIPLLTVLADAMGIFGGWFFGTQVLGVNSFFYWHHTLVYITAYDFMSGLIKSVFFGASIGLIASHQGFQCGSGAEGVGRAATQAFVFSFVSILVLDFLIGIVVNRLFFLLWPVPSAFG